MYQGVFPILKNIIIRDKIKLLNILFLILFLLFLYFIYQSISLNYLPIFSDEYSYYLDSKSFWLYNRIDAAITFNERYSVIGQAGFHGFMYSVLYGAFFKIFAFFGITPSIMLANIVLVLCLFVFLAFSRIKLENKLLIGIIFLSNYIFVIYISSSMTEIFHYIFAVVVGYLLYLVYQTKESKYLYMLITLIFLLLPFRESWVFVLFGLFPLAGSLKDFVKYSMVLFLGLIVVIVWQKYFQAAFPIDYFHSIKTQLSNESLVNIIYPMYDHFLANIDKYFLSETYKEYRFVFYYKYLFVAVLLYALYDSYRKRDKAILSGAIIAIIFFLSLLVLYDAFGWREARALIVPFIILTVIFILKQRYFAVSLIILFQLFNLYAVLDAKQSIDSSREKMNVLIKEKQPLLDDFSELESYVASFDKKEITVLVSLDLTPSNDSPLFNQLPLSLGGKFIRYSIVYGNFNILDSMSDLYISSKMEKGNNMKLLGQNRHFYFYQLIPIVDRNQTRLMDQVSIQAPR